MRSVAGERHEDGPSGEICMLLSQAEYLLDGPRTVQVDGCIDLAISLPADTPMAVIYNQLASGIVTHGLPDDDELATSHAITAPAHQVTSEDCERIRDSLGYHYVESARNAAGAFYLRQSGLPAAAAVRWRQATCVTSYGTDVIATQVSFGDNDVSLSLAANHGTLTETYLIDVVDGAIAGQDISYRPTHDVLYRQIRHALGGNGEAVDMLISCATSESGARAYFDQLVAGQGQLPDAAHYQDLYARLVSRSEAYRHDMAFYSEHLASETDEQRCQRFGRLLTGQPPAAPVLAYA